MTEDDVEDIYPLTPLQQGFLWHSLAGADSELGVEQIGLVLRGPLRMDAYAQAWQHVVDRHPVLRTAFAWEDLDEALQLVYQHATLTVDVHASDTLVAAIPGDVIAVSESGLKTAADITRLKALGYRAFLLGERLMTTADPRTALAELLEAANDERRTSNGERR